MFSAASAVRGKVRDAVSAVLGCFGLLIGACAVGRGGILRGWGYG